MNGIGWTYAGYDAFANYGARGTSTFSITFGVDRLTDFTLGGNIDAQWTDVSVSLTKDGGDIFSFGSLVETGDFNFSDQFIVGSTYTLSAFSSADYSDYYDETWQFDLTTASAVPVPAAVWLLGSGLIGLIGIAKRKRSD